MKMLFILPVFVYGLVLAFCWSCMEIHPIIPFKDPPLQTGPGTGCTPAGIEKNIVGRWHFESTLNPNNAVSEGSVTFNADGTMTDPDSLFENTLDAGTVTGKQYDPTLPSPFPEFPGEFFTVTLLLKQTQVIFYFTLVSNECDRIVLRLLNSGNNAVRITLTR